jgi:hypothetical protein
MLNNEDEQVVAGDGGPSPLFVQTDGEMGKIMLMRLHGFSLSMKTLVFS